MEGHVQGGEEIMQAVRRMTNLFKEFLLKVVSSQFETISQ